MDFMLANDWLQVINNAQQQNEENISTPATNKEVHNNILLLFYKIYSEFCR